VSHNNIFFLWSRNFFLLYTQMLYYDFLVTMHLLFLVFVVGSPLFVRGYSYENGIVKCPDEIVGIPFNVTELNNTNFTKVNQTMLLGYRDNDNFEKFTTSCTTNVTDMMGMFSHLDTFNHSISTWDTSSVTNMTEMFAGATSFNSDISKWDTSSVIDMYDMFYFASNFNQSLTNWCVNISEPNGFAIGSPIKDYPAFLPLWNGTGCTNKCYNGIRNTSDYSCTCNSGHFGPTCALTPDYTITVSNYDSTAYHFKSSTGIYIKLLLQTSKTYFFELGATTMTSHPFQLSYNNGTHVGTVLSTGVLLTTDPVAANYTYKCATHPAMTGTILSYEPDTTSPEEPVIIMTTEPVTTTTEPNTTSTPSIEEDSINVNLIIGLVSGGVVLVGSAFFVVYKCLIYPPSSGYTLTTM
jgi:surface protein